MRTGWQGISVLVLVAAALLPSTGEAAKSSSRSFSWGPTVIYGEDNRLDLFQVTNERHLALADSTVALVKSEDIKDKGDGSSELVGPIFGERMNLCASEPFIKQTMAAFCSGFLVDDETIVTAGHCVEGPEDCEQTKFVFGYAIKSADAPHAIAKNEEIYSCAKVVHTEVNGGGADFAVIKLDRKVLNHKSLELRKEGSLATGDELVVIGHPSGLPTKVAAGAAVRSLDSGFFVANLDTYGGNSGSAVFNDKDGKVEGILVRGENDFINSPEGCIVSNRCASNECRGEDVTLISTVLPYLSSSTPPATPPADPATPVTPFLFP